MSGVATRMHRTDAIKIAKRFVALIEPYTDRLIVAGSLRRKLAMIGDIEIVAVPKIETVETETTDLFGTTFGMHEVDRLDACMDELWRQRIVEQTLNAAGNAAWGTSYKRCIFDGAPIDLFSPNAERFGWILMLRTGPYQFSKQLVVPKGKRTNDGRPGLLPPHLISEGGWLRYRTSREQIPTPASRAFSSSSSCLTKNRGGGNERRSARPQPQGLRQADPDATGVQAKERARAAPWTPAQGDARHADRRDGGDAEGALHAAAAPEGVRRRARPDLRPGVPLLAL